MGKGGNIPQRRISRHGICPRTATLCGRNCAIECYLDGTDSVQSEGTLRGHQERTEDDIQEREGSVVNPGPTICLVQSTDDSQKATVEEQQFFMVMRECYDKFIERNRERHGVWKRSGLRGQTHEIFAKAERAYMDVFIAQTFPDRDHYRDLVNYSLFAMMLLDAYEGLPVPKLNNLLHGEWPR